MNKGKGPKYQFYGRRKGIKIRARQSQLLETLLPKIRITPQSASRLIADAGELWLEIGFGGGEHLAYQAANNPHVTMLGCEPFVNGVAKLLSIIDQQNLENIVVFDDDARYLLPEIPDSSISRAFILYPDPWPKKRHKRRRFINQDNLNQLHRILKPNSRLRIASDIDDYIDWTLHEIQTHGGFDWLAKTPSDWRNPPDDWTSTRYEQKAIREGRVPVYLDFERV